MRKPSGVSLRQNGCFVPAKLFSLLRDGFEDRAESDYGLTVITDEQARAGIAAAREFVETVGNRFEKTRDDEP